jgi:hypothetical protein
MLRAIPTSADGRGYTTGTQDIVDKEAMVNAEKDENQGQEEKTNTANHELKSVRKGSKQWFRCDVCTKVYERQERLNEHMARHENQMKKRQQRLQNEPSLDMFTAKFKVPRVLSPRYYVPKIA